MKKDSSDVPHGVSPSLWRQLDTVTWLSAAEAARLLGVRRESITAQVSKGRIRALRSGNPSDGDKRVVLIPLSELEHYRATTTPRGPQAGRRRPRAGVPETNEEDAGG